MWTRLAVDVRPTVAAIADTIGHLIEELTGGGQRAQPSPQNHLRRGDQQVVLRSEIDHLQDEIGSWMAPLLDELGSADPRVTSTTSWR